MSSYYYVGQSVAAVNAQPILAPNGTVALPGISFTNAPSYGLYFTAGQLNIATNGAQAAYFTSTQQFAGYRRVVLAESGTYNLLAADTGKIIKITGAAQVTINLPAVANSGATYSFIAVGSGGFLLQTSGTNTIIIPGAVTSGGGTLATTQMGATVTIVDSGAVAWSVLALSGTFTTA